MSKKPCGKLREGIDTYTKGWIRAAELVLKRGREQYVNDLLLPSWTMMKDTSNDDTTIPGQIA